MDARLDPRLLDVARRMVPRYTSYPTAPHFSPAVGPTPMRMARGPVQVGRGGLDLPARPLLPGDLHLLRLHHQGHPTGRAGAGLCQPDAPGDQALGGRARSGGGAHLHWGGGTPDLLPPDCLETPVRDLADSFRFRPDMTHAIELDPRHITGEDARRLAGLGVGRASLGVQTLDGAVQRAIARVQPLPVVAAAFASLRAAGITAINADLMYGLPLQSSAAFRDTVRQVLALAPSRFAIFGYAHVPWMKPHQKRIDEATLPDTRGRMLQAAPAREILAEGGYVAIGIDHFARPDDEPTAAFRARRLGRNFQGYTTDRAAALVGIGASAISRTPSGLAQNARDNAGWRRAIEAGRLPTVQGKAFTGDDVLRAAVIEELLCYFEVDLAEAARRHRAPLAAFADDVARLLPMAAAGWLEIEGSRLRIREHGHEIARVVASGFDAYLGRGGRHSLAA